MNLTVEMTDEDENRSVKGSQFEAKALKLHHNLSQAGREFDKRLLQCSNLPSKLLGYVYPR